MKKYKRVNNDSRMVFSLIEVMIVMFISLVCGVLIGHFVNGEKVLNNRYYHSREIVRVYNNILDNYYYDDIDEKELANAAVRGMIESLSDPYSFYMNGESASQFNESIDGSFVGIGVTIQYNPDIGYNTIIKVLKNGPADRAGIKEGDILIKVNDTDVHEVYGDDLTKLVRGKIGSIVTITVKRNDKTKVVNVKRDIIELDSVHGEVINSDDKKVGYIRIDTFASNTYKQFNNNLKKLEKDGIESLIIDVRNNPGGHLTQTRKILSLFFDKKTVLYMIDNQKVKKKVYSLTNEKRTYPVVVLIDNESASASEIIAACFKDNYKNISLVGTTTYGKGTVQKSQKLNTGTNIKYTAERWLTPKGKCVEGKGIKPDYEVKLSEDYYKDPKRENDNQLQEALKALKKES